MSSDKNSELYWAQFGFADYAKDFDKLGIKTIEQLRSRAVELERDYKLDGLC